MVKQVIVLFLSLVLGNVQATEVIITNEWIPNFGWKIHCTWELFRNDSLQSVTLSYNDQQLLSFRPKTDGEFRVEKDRRTGDFFEINCTKSSEDQVKGTCEITIELFREPSNFTMSCEVSGERPMFLIKKKKIHIDPFVPPTDALIEVEGRNVTDNEELGRVELNCTSTGLPKPTLVWTIAEQTVPSAFTCSNWNIKTKLWEAWSVINFTPKDKNLSAVCTPQSSNGSHLLKGDAAVYSSADKAVTTNASLKVVSKNEETLRVDLKCTASGLPSPKLMWTIGNEEVSSNITGSDWNTTTMVRDAWSVISFEPTIEHPRAVCTPIGKNESQPVKGHADVYEIIFCDLSGLDVAVIPNASVKVVSKEESGRVVLNCTASGSRSPKLVWTIGDEKVVSNITGSVWNTMRMEWDAWSVISFAPTKEHASAVCTKLRRYRTKRSAPVNEVSFCNSGGQVAVTRSIIVAFSIFLLLLK